MARKTQKDQDREAKLRARYAEPRCVCGRNKNRREPFCKACLGVLGSTDAPRPMLRGDLDDRQTADAFEVCLSVLIDKGYVREGVTL